MACPLLTGKERRYSGRNLSDRSANADPEHRYRLLQRTERDRLALLHRSAETGDLPSVGPNHPAFQRRPGRHH
ncbi:hypothetical protein D3C72_2119260 [compost metagenome]